MNLSRHFTLAEMTRSETATRERIDNQPGAAVIESLRQLCAAVLDPLRDALGSAIKVNSGYRSPALNQRIGGAANSQHVQGQAADLQAPAVSVLDLFKRVIQLGLPFDQVIYEAQNATTKWVHVSHNPGANRGEIRVAQFGPNGKPTGYPQITKQQALDMVERVSRSSKAAAELAYVAHGDEPEQITPVAPKKRPAARKAAPKRATVMPLSAKKTLPKKSKP